MAVVSLLLKLTAAFSEPLSDSNVSNLCMGFSKGVTYITVAMLAVGFMLFITILLMIFSHSGKRRDMQQSESSPKRRSEQTIHAVNSFYFLLVFQKGTSYSPDVTFHAIIASAEYERSTH